MEICKFYSAKFSIKKCEYGLGVFSNENIKSDTVLEEIIPLRISKELFTLHLLINKICKFLKIKNKTTLFKFLGFESKEKIFHVLPTMFMYCNHSTNMSNIKCIYNNESGLYKLILTKDVSTGDQILLNYNMHHIFYKN
jgi:hypothetical protein